LARILVIDDEEPIQFAVQIMLQKENHEILTASNGEIGLELLRNEPFDLVITDILMPEKGGIEVIAEIQKTKPEVKIIAMSAGGARGDLNFLEHAQLLGAEAVLQKPFEREEILDLVKEVLQKDD
tara:strand:- start:122 stop:496 length:375 start_codon:yes stop_codon:yes gene_type:complete